jgi:hypothetical protein
MHALTEKQIRASFVNASKREAADATLPDLDAVAWENVDYLGWRDRKAPLAAYVIVEVDDEPVGVLLRATDKGGKRKKAVCQWCADVVVTDDVTLYVAKRGGASGKNGNTIGTLICTDFICSQNVRRPPTRSEVGDDADAMREYVIERRIAELRERAAKFADEVRSTR